jgi:hypothetical protein
MISYSFSVVVLLSSSFNIVVKYERRELRDAAQLYHEAAVGLFALASTRTYLASQISHLILSTAGLAQQCSGVLASLVKENFKVSLSLLSTVMTNID